jgi:hypothetical protein
MHCQIGISLDHFVGAQHETGRSVQAPEKTGLTRRRKTFDARSRFE